MPPVDEVVDGEVKKIEKTAEEGTEESTAGAEEETSEETAGEEDEQEESDDDKKEEEDDDLDELSVKEAKVLYKALKDPSTRNQMLEALVNGFGHKPETKTEVKEAKRDIVGKLKESLGVEFGFLAEKLGPAIESILADERKEHAESIGRLEQANIQKEVASVLADIKSGHKGGDWNSVEAKIVRLMDEMTPGPRTSVKDYLRNLYSVATAGKAKVGATNEIADKIRKNANDVSGRLTSRGGVGEGEVKFDPNKKYSLNESVDLALRSITQKAKK